MEVAITSGFPYGQRTEIGKLSVNCLTATVAGAFTWEVPEPGENTVVDVRVQGGVDFPDRATFTYTYAWNP